jgi:hypothetical protein
MSRCFVYPVCKPHLPDTKMGDGIPPEGYYGRIYREQFAGDVKQSPPPSTTESIGSETDASEKTTVMPKRVVTREEQLENTIALLKAELRFLNSQLEKVRTVKTLKPSCIICIQFPVVVLFDPCRHAVCCEKCSKQLKQCPICRAPLTFTSRILFS